jgi:hypothetical protein
MLLIKKKKRLQVSWMCFLEVSGIKFQVLEIKYMK